MAHKVLILHDNADGGIAIDLFFKLREQGLIAWLPGGSPVSSAAEPVAFEIALAEAHAVVALLSASSQASPSVVAQIDAAARAGKQVMALSIDGRAIDPASMPMVQIGWTLAAEPEARQSTLDQLRDYVIRVALARPEHDADPLLAYVVGWRGGIFVAQWKGARSEYYLWSWEAFAGGPAWLFFRGLSAAGLATSLILVIAVAFGKYWSGTRLALILLVIAWLALSAATGAWGSLALRKLVLQRRKDRLRVPAAMPLGFMALAIITLAASFLVRTGEAIPPNIPDTSAQPARSAEGQARAAEQNARLAAASDAAAPNETAKNRVQPLPCQDTSSVGGAMFGDCAAQNDWFNNAAGSASTTTSSDTAPR